MANSDKDILITPNTGQSAKPKIEVTGANNATKTITINDDGTISFDSTIEATSGSVADGNANLVTGDAVFDYIEAQNFASSGASNFVVGDITGQTEITSGLASTDEFVISDAGVLKRMDTSVLQSFMQSNLTFTTNTDTQLSTEQVQDIVGAMFSSNTETRISATYQDGDGTIDLVVDDMTANTQLTTEEVQDIVGAMFTSNTETRISATYEDGDGTIDLVVDDMTADTNTFRTVTAGGNTLGGSETLAFTAGSNVTITESGGAVTIASTDTNTQLTLLDQDDMSSNSATAAASQQSVKAYVDNELASLVDSAPSALNTLNELAAALGDDASFSTTTATSLGNRLRVDVSNQGLNSTQQGNALTNLGITASLAEINILDDGLAASDIPNLATSKITSGTFADARIAESNVTQHQAALSITESQISDLQSYLTAPRTVTAGGNTLANGETLAFTAGSNITISESGGAVTIAAAASTGASEAFKTIAVSGQDDVVADAAADTLTFAAGSNVTLTTNASSDTITITATDTNTQLSTEQVQDIVGAMFSSNTETRVSATYEDGDGTIDLVVDDMTRRTITAGGNTLADGETLAFTAGSNVTISESGGAVTIASTDTNTQLSTEQVQDIVGAMFSSNTETRISATYQDGDGTIDLVVDDMTTDTNTNQLTTFTLTGDSGSNQTIAHGNTLDIAGGDGIATVVGSTDTVTVGLDIDGMTDIGAALVDADLMIVDDGAGGTNRKATMSRLKTYMQNNLTFTTNTDTQLSTEQVQDIAGGMFSSNTETGITATYQDADGTIDLVVGTLNQDTSGNAATATALETARNIGGVSFDGTANINLPGVNTAGNQNTSGTAALATTVTVTDSTANTNFPVVFHDESNGLLDDTGALRYNPSTGTLLVPNLNVAGTTTTVDTVTMEAANAIVFEGATSDTNETTLTITDPTADRTITLPDATGTVALTSQLSDTQLTTEEVQDIVGAMFSSNTETRITATYQDGDGTIDLVVDDMTTDTNTNQLTTFTLTGDSGSNQTIAHGNTLDIAGGDGIATVVGSTDTVTVGLDIDGMTDIGAALVDADLMIVDDGAGGTNRKATMSRLKTYMQNNLTFTTDTNTQLSNEQVQDIAGGMFSSNTETLITATYQDGDGTIDLVVDNDLSNYDNSSSGFITATLTTEEVQDIVGAMFSGNTETRVSATYQDGDGTIDLVADNMNFSVSDITGATALTSGLASTDELVLSDAGTLKRMDISVLQSYMQSNLTFTTNTNTQLSDEQVQDIVGAMFSSNTETGITATYQDGDGTIDLVVSSSGMSDLVDDTSPQLGGDLDVNGNKITSASNADVTIEPNGTGDINLYADTLVVGDSSADFTIQHRTTTNSILRFQAGGNTQLTSDGPIFLNADEAGDGGSDSKIRYNAITNTFGKANTNTVLTTQGTGDMTLSTNSGTNSGTIVIADGANGNISLTPNGTGNVALGNFTFNADQTVGSSQDNFVLTYDNSSGTIGLESASGGGASTIGALTDVLMDATNFTNGFLLQTDSDGSAPTTGTLNNALENIGLGKDVFASLTSGDYNIGIGNDALDALTTAVENVAIGYQAGSAIQGGGYNTVLGTYALLSVTSGLENVAIGRRSLGNVTSSLQYNTAVGGMSGYGATGNYSTSIGNQAGRGSIGQHGVHVGALAGYNSSGTGGVNIGYRAGRYPTGNYNTFLGYEAGYGASGNGAANNVAIGYEALHDVTTGSKNMIIGYEAGDNITSGSNNLVIGCFDVDVATGDDQIIIGSGDGGVTWLKGDSNGIKALKIKVKSVSSNTTLTDAQSGSYVYWTAGTLTLPATAESGQQYTIINNTGGSATPSLGTSNAIASGWTAHAAMADETARTYVSVAANKWIYIG
tara:strand:- start:9705 stop:15326 length:5622 start_codon:yes stop_codon:yes gene_type:complete